MGLFTRNRSNAHSEKLSRIAKSRARGSDGRFLKGRSTVTQPDQTKITVQPAFPPDNTGRSLPPRRQPPPRTSLPPRSTPSSKSKPPPRKPRPNVRRSTLIKRDRHRVRASQARKQPDTAPSSLLNVEPSPPSDGVFDANTQTNISNSAADIMRDPEYPGRRYFDGNPSEARYRQALEAFEIATEHHLPETAHTSSQFEINRAAHAFAEPYR